MTRASLQYALNHATALGPAEERELEMLAQAFPYCQTAHLLLAKAAHDRGTMLAGQRLRRAATYAADRTLLRHLIEQVPEIEIADLETDALVARQPQPGASVPAAAVAVPGTAAATTAIAQEPQDAPPAEALVPAALPALAVATRPAEKLAATPATTVTETEAAREPAVAEQVIIAPAETSAPDTAGQEAGTPEAAAPETNAVAAKVAAPVTEELPVIEPTPVPEVMDTTATTQAEPAPAEPALAKPEAVLPIIAEPVTATEDATTATDLTATEPGAPAVVSQAAPEAPPPPPAAAEAEIPATAPPIRPPDETGVARFEFGLQPPAPAPVAYELPLVDEWAAAATTLTLKGRGFVDEQPVAATEPAKSPTLTEAAFTGDAAVGYALAEGSRYGYGLGLLEMAVLAKLDADGEAAMPAAEAAAREQYFSAGPAAPPVQPLPPTGAFFEPDVLLLAHWATHCPPAPLAPSSLDLINNFLRRQPRLSRPAMLPPSPTAQADLSTRSTRAEPELASEGLAQILARQGKNARAIEIYERLMVKQPEKIAYFAALIQQLQPPA